MASRYFLGHFRQSCWLMLTATGLLACAEDQIVSAPEGGPPPRTAAAVEAPKPDVPPVVDFQEAAFVESERSRDPFRSFARAFLEEARGTVKSQRDVVLEEYAIEELKLVGLVTGSAPELAMLVDPVGLGHVVTRGQFIGRAQVVQPSGGVGAAYEVNWRVDRIRDGDLVLVRDDPSNPDVPSASRVIPLRTDELSVKQTGEGSDDDLRSQLDQLKERLASMEAADTARARSTSTTPPPPPKD